jgi:hypothetical protein
MPIRPARSNPSVRRGLPSMLAAFVFAAAVASAPACGVQDDPFKGSVPTSDSVNMKLPDGTASTQSALTASDGATGARTSALLGDRAEYYTLTRTVTSVVNGATGTVLALIHTIVSYPASSVKGDVAVWGPYTDPLSPNTWRLTVTRAAPHAFDYVLEARAKQDPDTAFITILAGHHNAVAAPDGGNVEGLGSGTFTVDWDAAQTLPEHDTTVGKATFTYARASFTGPTTIDVTFNGIRDDQNGEIYNAVYQYASTPGAGGDFQYAAHRDVVPGPGPTGTAQELLTVHSRWLETGAGRADVQISGGDVPAAIAPADVSECWDANFASQYKNVSYDATAGWGQESSCAFATADYSSLS